MVIGEACDLRRTDEGRKRLSRLKHCLPLAAVQMAVEELSS